jgi:hypothetical protein
MKHLSVFTFIGLMPGLILFLGCSKKSSTAPGGPGAGAADSATVTVVNGYGSGKYKIGDTVDIWSGTIPANTIFDSWTGFGSLLENAGEWHNRFIMPSQDVTVTATQRSIAPFTLNYEKIKGVNILKNVYYYFPSGHKGIVYLCHGTGGSARNLVTNFEWMEMINNLVAANYAIVVTEAEEVSLNTDLNADGKIRWTLLPVDTNSNVDYANIRALTDTFIVRGYTQPSVPRYSIGMSDGGGFEAALSFLYKFAAGVSYCAPTSTVVTSSSITPLQFCMAKYDNASEVGPTGNATALTNSNALIARGICSKYFLHDHSPVYPQRFARRGDISLTTSASIYNELKTNHWLDSKNYLTAVSDTISARILANPAAYPVTSALTIDQYMFYTGELDIMYAAHQFFSDYNKTTIRFMTTPCQ